MQTSPRGIALIREFEGLSLTAYRDIAGVPTIGFGHIASVTEGDVAEKRTISEAEAESLLRGDLRSREAALNSWMITEGVELNQNEWDALISFIYNVGFKAFKGSTAARRLKDGDRIGAADALTWWNKATVRGELREVMGLTRRRAAEKELFLTPKREITAKTNTARAVPMKETSPLAPRLRCKIYDRSQLRKS